MVSTGPAMLDSNSIMRIEQHFSLKWFTIKGSYQGLLALTTLPRPQSNQLDLPMAVPKGCPSLPVTTYSYIYSYGVAPASELPAIPMAVPMGWPQPPSYQLFLWLFLSRWLAPQTYTPFMH